MTACMSKTGDNRERRQDVKDAKDEGMSASEAGASTGASKQISTEEHQHRRRDDDEQGKPG